VEKGKGGRGKPGINWPQKATKGHKERGFFLCVLCVPLWPWRFGASLLPASDKGSGGLNSRKSLISKKVSERFRYF
jgi:hypothetical protein